MMGQRLKAWLTTWAEKLYPRPAPNLLTVRWMAFLFLGLSGPALAAQDARVKPGSQCPEARHGNRCDRHAPNLA